MRMMKFTLVLSIMLSFVMMVPSCGSPKQVTDKGSKDTNMDQMNGTWILKSLNGQKTEDAFKGKTPSMTLDMAGRRIYGNGGCNRYTGVFTLENGVFSAPNVAATMMMCVFENKESEFFAMLAKTNTVSIADGTLTFRNGGRVVSEFVRGIDADMLAGTWSLVSIEGEDMKSLFPMAERQATIEFDIMENRIGGNAGCNGYGASYTLEGSTIAVGPIMATKMACENLSGENKFTQILSGTSVISVSEEELTFSKDGKIVLKFVKAK